MRRRIVAIFVILGFIVAQNPSFSFAAKKAKNTQQVITARSLFALDLKENKVIMAKDEHLRLPPASTTKLMSAILVIENSKLDKEVVVSKKAMNTEASKAYLKEGERYLTRDLLKAILISSANDAAVALSEDIAGSEDKFALMMNKKAKRLGALNTKFANSTGLPEKGKDQYTTTYDLVIIMKQVMKYPELLEIMNIKTTNINSVSANARTIKLRSHNKLLWEFDGAVIGKTGYTRAAMHCFAGMQTMQNKRFLFAILKSKSPRPDIRNLHYILEQLTRSYNI